MARRFLFFALLASALVHPSSSIRAQEVGVDDADRVTRYGVMKPPPNVSWDFGNNVTACPAGDSVVAGHPCRLRVTVSYIDANFHVKNGVPPESIFVLAHRQSGTIKINDETIDDIDSKVFADDSTRSGAARIQFPSISGCGTVRMTLYVSNVPQGAKTATVRTVDTDADANRRVTTADQNGVCDLNYDGSSNSADVALVTAHLNHWHHNALFGSMVRRTNLCETCTPGTDGTMGSGDLSWSPDGVTLAFSSRNANNNCSIKLVPSDPANGNTVTALTNPAPGVEDYDPQWSPLGDVVIWDRDDTDLYKKDPSSPSNPEFVVYHAPVQDGATQPSISPDGRRVAFSGVVPGVGQSIYVVNMDGTGVVQLTNTASVFDQWPKWSPDGQTIVFFRSSGATNSIWSIPASGGTATQILSSTSAAFPAYSPDGAIIVCGIGASGTLVANTFDPSLGSSAPPISAYTDYQAFLLSPRLSPDGTRLAIIARTPGQPTTVTSQLWATRRNMSLPPSISTVGGVSVNNAHPVIDFTAIPGTALNLIVNASDPEGDALTYAAYFMRTDLGMSFNTGTHTFSWNAPVGASDSVYNVRFNVTTFSGGTDYAIARITVADRMPPADVSDLHVQLGHTTAVALWTAPGDNGNVGNATAFDLRYANFTINDGNFSQATPMNAPQPGPPGTQECGDVFGLTPCQAYWFAVKTVDDAGNWSNVSNVPSGEANCNGSLEFACASPQDAQHPPTGVVNLPKVAELAIQGPNPTHGPFALSFGVPAVAAGGDLSLGVFDVAGRRVASLRREHAIPGRYVTQWDLRDTSGRRVATGIYFVHFEVGRSRLTRSVLIVN